MLLLIHLPARLRAQPTNQPTSQHYSYKGRTTIEHTSKTEVSVLDRKLVDAVVGVVVAFVVFMFVGAGWQRGLARSWLCRRGAPVQWHTRARRRKRPSRQERSDRGGLAGAAQVQTPVSSGSCPAIGGETQQGWEHISRENKAPRLGQRIDLSVAASHRGPRPTLGPEVA